jgi:hypothetical protein
MGGAAGHEVSAEVQLNVGAPDRRVGVLERLTSDGACVVDERPKLEEQLSAPGKDVAGSAKAPPDVD